MKTFKVEKNGKLIKSILNFYGDKMPYSTACKLLRKKDVKINGVRVGKDVDVFSGDEISVYYEEKERELSIIYKDENLLVLYKPCHITSEEFFDRVKSEYKEAGFIHRLDRNTDGIIFFSLNETAEKELIEGFKERYFEKYYLTEVYGKPKKEHERLEAYLVKDEKNSLVKVYGEKRENAEKIITEYTVKKAVGETAVLEVKLITGKTHQIRAHLSYENLFILGDGKYGRNDVNKKFNLKYQKLTAYKAVLHFSADKKLSYLDGKVFEIKTDKYGV